MIKMLSVAAIVAILIAMIMKMLPEAVFFPFYIYTVETKCWWLSYQT